MILQSTQLPEIVISVVFAQIDEALWLGQMDTGPSALTKSSAECQSESRPHHQQLNWSANGLRPTYYGILVLQAPIQFEVKDDVANGIDNVHLAPHHDVE